MPRRAGWPWAAGSGLLLALAAAVWAVADTPPPPSGLALAAGLGAAVAALVAWHAAGRERALAAALAHSRHQERELTDLVDAWLWQSDRQHGVQSLRPPPGADVALWAEAEAGRPLWEQFEPVDAVQDAALRAALRAHDRLPRLAVWRASAEGGRVRCELRGAPCLDALGGFKGYLGSLRELAPEAAPSEAEPTPEAHRHEAESFSYTVSHDLRAPVRVVEGFAKILKEDYGQVLDRIGNDHLDRVLGAAARMNSMIDALLALAQLGAKPLARQPVNLSQLAGYVVDDLRRQAPERRVAVHIAPEMLVQGDPTLLRMVVENLLGNAWKYSAKRPDAEIWFERSVQDRRTLYTVRDNGAGFDMRFADRLFGVFQRLHSASDFAGTGIGLASVRRIVERHGGEVWAEAEVGRGASFHFTLPLAAPGAAAAQGISGRG